MHELYCAGHLIEAGVAYFQGTGRRKLPPIVDGYARITRTWRGGDKIKVQFPMPVRMIQTNPLCRNNIGNWRCAAGRSSIVPKRGIILEFCRP